MFGKTLIYIILQLVLAIGFVSMVLSTLVLLQAETTRNEGVEIPPPADLGGNEPDIIKLPPVPPQVQVPGEKKVGGEGVNDKIPDEGGGGVVDGDKDQRKEPPLPQEVAVVDKPKVVEENNKDIAKPVEPEKPVELVKVDNPGDSVIDIPPGGGEAKQKPAEPVLPDPNKQPAKVVEEKAEGGPKQEKQKDTGKQELGGANSKVEEGKAVVEDKAKESDKRDSQEGEVNKDDHKQLEKHLEKLSDRLDQLEEENKELREKQEVIQRIQIQQGEEQVAGNGEQAKVPPAPQDVAPKEIEKKDLHQENVQNIPKDSDSNAAAVKPNAAAALDIDKHEKDILDALEKEEDRAERGIDEQLEQNENEQAIEEHKAEVVGEHKAAAAGGAQPVEERRAVGVDDEAVGGQVGGDTNVEKGKERVREERDVGLDSKIEVPVVHQVEQDELGENAGNINIAAPVADREKKSVGAGGENEPPPQDSVKYRKRDLKNANGSILSR